MDKIRIEVAPTLELANERAEWMRQKGYAVESPVEYKKATWSNKCPDGKSDTARTEDGTVRVIIGRKPA